MKFRDELIQDLYDLNVHADVSIEELAENIISAIQNVVGRDYVRMFGSCPMCTDCPDGCFLETQTQKAANIDTDINVGSNNGWIPCSIRLPERNKPVLVCDKDGWISVTINMPYAGVKNDFESGYYVAWMELPQSYKEVE